MVRYKASAFMPLVTFDVARGRIAVNCKSKMAMDGIKNVELNHDSMTDSIPRPPHTPCIPFCLAINR